jgi:nucleotide-binding universal stress UspA family protein
MYHRILVPLDGSSLSKQILPYARWLAKGLECPIELMRVMEPVPATLDDSAHGVYPHRVAESLKSHLEDYLETKATSLRDAGLQVSLAVYEGNPAEHIIGEAEKDPETLIAMSTHGRSGITRWIMGSVANKVLQGTSNPLLMVRASQEEDVVKEVELRTVIVPLDRSPMSEQALPHAASLAKALGLKLVLLWVFPLIEGHYTDLGIGATTYGVPMQGEVSQAVESEANHYFATVEEELRRLGAPEVESHLLWGQPASTIIDFARQTPNNLVAMTTHGRSGIDRWVLGSVTDRVVRHSEDPVLVIRSAE